MRTATGPEQAVLGSRYTAQFCRVEIQDEYGDWVDYTDYLDLDLLDSVELTQSNDERIMQATVEIARNVPDGSLSPLINSDIDLGRGMRVYGARVASGTLPGAGDWKLLLDGRVDRWEAASDPMRLTGRDMAGVLVDRWVEAETSYGSEEGTPIEDVMQEILDDWADGVFTLYVPAGSGILTTPFVIYPYTVEPQGVWDALQALAQMIGYVLEYRWDSDTGAFRLTLMEPERNATVPDWTFGPDDYYDVTKLDADLSQVRNAWSGRYQDSDGEVQHVERVNQESIDRFGIRLWAELVEGSDSPIDTAPEMTAMLDAALADCSMPDAEHEIDPDLFWPVQLMDYYRHSPNAVHYDANQDFAVSAFTHTFQGGSAATRILTRGKPSGSPKSWRRRALRRGKWIFPGGPGLIVTLDLDGDDLYMTWLAASPIAQLRWLTEANTAPDKAEVRASDDVDHGGAVKVHTFDPSGDKVQQVWVGYLAETVDGVEVRDLAVVPFTYKVGSNLPTVSLIYLGRTANGYEKWLATATGAGAQATLYYRTYVKGAAPPAYTQIGPAADPVQKIFSFAHPKDGDPNVVIEAYAEDDATPPLVSDVVYRESDSDIFPSGDIDLTCDEANDISITPKSIDTDSLSYRFRAVVAAKGSDAFADPVFSDVATDEWRGTGTDIGKQVQVSDVASAIGPLKDGEELYVSGWMFNTASTDHVLQGLAVRSALIRRSIPAAFIRNKINSAWLEFEVVAGVRQVRAFWNLATADGTGSLKLSVTENGGAPVVTKVNAPDKDGDEMVRTAASLLAVYVLTVTCYSGADYGGVAGVPVEYTLAAHPSTILSAWLELETFVNAPPVGTYQEFVAHWNLATADVGSLKLVIDEVPPGFDLTVKINAPDKDGSELTGYEPQPTGTYSLTVTPYSAADYGGVAGAPVTYVWTMSPAVVATDQDGGQLVGPLIIAPTGSLKAVIDANGNISASLRLTVGTAAPGALAVGALYGRHA